jgi:sulfur-carrier protein adenylyltransferase/sulfurtransferase
MKEKTVSELKQMMDNHEDFQLIDVREPHEYDICHLDAELIPVGDVPDNVSKFSKDKPVIIHCRSGARSGRICEYLEQNFGYNNVYNLKGGIIAWADQIDPAMQKY